MFSVNSIMAGPFGAFQMIDRDIMRCAFLQVSGSPEPPRAALMDLLRETNATTASEPEEAWPRELANALDAALRRAMADPTGDLPSSAFFAGLSLSANAVHVCTAGDLRIHLLVNGTLTRVTRDHVYAHDPLDPPLPDLLPEIAASLATRQLGGTLGRPPECQVWAVDGPYTVVICSSQHHHWRSPDLYGPTQIRASLATAPPSEGLLFSIQRSVS